MTVDDWVLEAVEQYGKSGATVREVQRYIDEQHYEELAIDTIEASLMGLVVKGKLEQNGTHWQVVRRKSKEDALKQLFGS